MSKKNPGFEAGLLRHCASVSKSLFYTGVYMHLFYPFSTCNLPAYMTNKAIATV